MSRKIFGGLAVMLLVAGWLGAQVSTIVWQLPRGDERNSGFVSLPLRPPLSLLWHFVPPQPVRTNRFGFVHDGERAYMVTSNDLLCLNLVDAQRYEWRTENLPIVFTTPPILAGGRLFVGTSQGDVIAFDPTTGAQLATLSWERVSINALGTAKGWLFIGTSDGFVHAAPVQGEGAVASVSLGYPITTNFAVGYWKGGTFLCVGGAQRLFFLSLTEKNGQLRMRDYARPLLPGGTSLTDPVFDPKTETILVGSGNYVVRLSPRGSIIAFASLKGSVRGAPIIAADGTIYAATDERMVYAFEGLRPRVKWAREMPSSIHAPMLLTDGTLWLTTLDGLLYGLEAKSGEVLWRFRLGDVNPNYLSTGMLAPLVATPFGICVVDTNGRIYAFTVPEFAPDTNPPALYEPTLLLYGSDQTGFWRQIVGYRLRDDFSLLDSPAIPGRAPIYLRVRVMDGGSGVDERSLKAQLIALRPKPPQGTDLYGEFKPVQAEWLIYVHAGRPSPAARKEVAGGMRLLTPLPDGEYVVMVQAADNLGNRTERRFAFRVDNTLPPPLIQVTGLPGAPGAGGMTGVGPGMPGAGGVPGGFPGAPGGFGFGGGFTGGGY